MASPPPPAVGVGIIAKPSVTGHFTIMGLSEGSPADLSGQIAPGDILYEVDNRSVKNLEQQEVAQLILGPVNSSVTLSVKQNLPNAPIRRITLTRGTLHDPAGAHQMMRKTLSLGSISKDTSTCDSQQVMRSSTSIIPLSFDKTAPEERRIVAQTSDSLEQMQTADDDDDRDDGKTENVMERLFAKIFKDPRKLAIFYGVCNLSNYMIGAGMLGLTSVFASGGWLVGFIMLSIFGLSTWFSFDLLLDAAISAKVFSLEGLGFAVGGWPLQMFVRILVIIEAFGFFAAYMNLAGKTLLTLFWDDPNQATASANYAALTAWATIIFIIPMCFVKNMSHVALISFMSFLPLIYLFGFQIFYLSANGAASSGFSAVTGSSSVFFRNLATIVFAYICQPGLFPAYSGIICKDIVVSSNRMNTALRINMPTDEVQFSMFSNEKRKINAWTASLAWIVYTLCATLGYLAFPAPFSGNLLAVYPKSGAVDSLRVLIAISAIFSFPVILLPVRENFDKLIFNSSKSCFPARPLTTVRFYIQNIILCWIAYGVTVAIPEFRTILDLWGAFTGTFTGYIFPTAFYLKTSRISFYSNKKAWVALFMLIVGGLSGFTSLYFVIADQVAKGSL